VLVGNFIALNIQIRIGKISQINNPTLQNKKQSKIHLKKKREETNKHKSISE
jgi:hypothetical protein